MLSKIRKLLFSEYPENDCQDYTDNIARREGKVKSEPFFFDINIAGQFAQKRYLIGKHKSKPDNYEDDSQDN